MPENNRIILYSEAGATTFFRIFFMLNFSLPDWISFAFIFGYAEIHYRMKYFVSFLKMKQPEIIFDAPYRNRKDESAPIFLIINDAHQFPVRLLKVHITAIHESGNKKNISFDLNRFIDSPYEDFTFHISLDQTGFWKIIPKAECEFNSKIISITVDNYKKTKKEPLTIYQAEFPFPLYKNQFSGDLHYHTRYTFDQVEFGAGLGITQCCMNAIELNYLCTTDHSYDLDDDPNNYLQNTSDFPKWKQLLDEVKILNENSKNLIIPGFELSTGNKAGKNVHLLMYGQRNFIVGKGDGAEKWFQTKPDTIISEAVKRKDDQTAIYAAHPFENVDFLQSSLLGRGNYSIDDIINNNLPLQILNGAVDDTFQRSRQIWISLLLQSIRIPISAGNDAHGNFNRYRQIEIPFFTMRESNNQIFGEFRTIVQTGNLDEIYVLTALRNGNSYLTNGIAVRLESAKSEEILFSSEQNPNTVIHSSLLIKSTPEKGKLKRVEIYFGKESCEENMSIPITGFEAKVSLSDFEKEIKNARYVRLEIFAGLSGVLFSNPIYFK